MKRLLYALGLTLAIAAPSLAAHQDPGIGIDERLVASARHTQCLHLYGSGEAWDKATAAVKLTVQQGLEVRDPRLIRALLQNFRCTGQNTGWDDSSARGYIAVQFMSARWRCLDEIEYHPDGGGYDLVDRGTGEAVLLRAGYPARFEAFVRRLAARAHRHDPAVRVWDIAAS